MYRIESPDGETVGYIPREAAHSSTDLGADMPEKRDALTDGELILLWVIVALCVAWGWSLYSVVAGWLA